MSAAKKDSTTSKISQSEKQEQIEPVRKTRSKKVIELTKEQKIINSIIEGDCIDIFNNNEYKTLPDFIKTIYRHTDVNNISKKNDIEFQNEIVEWTATESYLKEVKQCWDNNIDSLYIKFPNFTEVTEFFDGQNKLNKIAHKWFKSRPVLLLGDPGIGKTHFSKELAKSLGLEFKVISCGSVTASWVISGLSSSWKGSKPGEIVRTLKNGTSANPIILLDEIDKLTSSKDGDPFGAMYSLLESDTAKVFIDEFLGFPVDTSTVNWIATANNIKAIPEAIVSRFKVINVGNPSKEDMKDIIKMIFNNMVIENSLEIAIDSITDEAIDFLANDCATPRKAQEAILESFGNAAMISNGKGKIKITPEHCKARNKVKHKMGF